VQGVFRLSGFALFGVAIVFWIAAPRPDILIDENGSLLGVLLQQGRVLNKETAYRFAASSWLENDGAGDSQSAAFFKAGYLYDGTQTSVVLPNGWRVVLERSKKTGAECLSSEILIAPKWLDQPAGDCFFVGQRDFGSGALAISFVDGQPVLQPAASEFPKRPWNAGLRPRQ